MLKGRGLGYMGHIVLYLLHTNLLVCLSSYTLNLCLEIIYGSVLKGIGRGLHWRYIYNGDTT
jgi:hypothetical protein